MSNNKYKSMLCKHYETTKGCSFGERCQFAHGVHELRSGAIVNNVLNQTDALQIRPSVPVPDKKANTAINYKIVKCKYWEKGI